MPTWTPTPEPTPTPTPAATPTPRPTATPTPTPVVTGDWTYFGPDCPAAYRNCASFGSEDVFITLDAYDDTNEYFYDEASISLSCFRGGLRLVFNGGGEWIGGATRTGLSVRYMGQGPDQGMYYWTDGNALEYVGFDSRATASIVEFLLQAEREGRDVTIGVSGSLDTVVADFDLTGLSTNLQRLPCVQG